MKKFGQSELTFMNYGGVYQLRAATLEDLRHLSTLDDPHWMATSAPVHQLRADPAFLDCMDSDGNERIISSDLRRVAAWLFRVLLRSDGVSERAEGLSLADVNPEDSGGAAILETARRVLANLERPDAELITLSDVRDQEMIMAKGDGNGDGVIPPGSVDDDEVNALIVAVMDTIGVVEDVSGADGIDEAHLQTFLDAAAAFLEWKRSIVENQSDAFKLMHPLGEDTAEAYDLLLEVAPKIDEWFDLCRLEVLNANLKRDLPAPTYPETLVSDASERDAYIANAPIASPAATLALSFDAPLNPYYADLLRLFQSKVYIPMVRDGKDHEEMDEATWRNLKLMFDAYGAWRDSKCGEQVERLGVEVLEGYVKGEVPARLRERFAEDVRAGQELKALKEVEKLILCQHCFLDLCNNFINFSDMYDPGRYAMFEMGRMVMDGRVFRFNVRVKDVKAHAKIAERSGIYLMYSEVTGLPGDKKFYVVTPVTCRHLGGLAVDKRGVLFDLDGKQWDVRVIKVVENSISLTEAVKAPFVRVSKMVSSAMKKFTASTEKQLEAGLTSTTKGMEKKMGSTIKGGGPKPAAKPAAAPAPAAGGGAKDLMLSGSMAIGILGSSMTLVLKMLSEIDPAAALSGVGIGLAVILVPAILVAVFRLHARNLSGILEASGWAINSRMRLTRRLGSILAPRLVHPKSFARVQSDMLKGFSSSLKGDETQTEEW